MRTAHVAVLSEKESFVETFWDEVVNPLFMPHGHCYLWKPGLLWIHVGSDVLIALAYYSIPFALLYFVRARRDLMFNSVFVMFSVFIFACGTTHLIEIINTWFAYYWIEGFVKILTALASVGTAFMMWPLIPKALRLPSPKMLQEKNQALEREIIDRKRAETELQKAHEQLENKVRQRTAQLEAQIQEKERAEERFRTLITATSSVIWNATPTGALAGRQPSWEAYTGQSEIDYRAPTWGWDKVIHPNEIESVKQRWADHLASHEVYEAEIRLWNADQQDYRYTAVKAVPLKDANGDVREWIGSITDIDEKKRAQEAIEAARDELEVSNRELERFAYITSHDLQEPLRKIQTFGDRLMAKHADQLDEKGMYFLDRILVSASRMQHLIRSLLLYSRTQTKERHCEKIQLEPLLAEVENNLEVRIAETKGRLRANLTESTIHGDPLLVSQLLQNLIGNALKFHREGVPPDIEIQSRIHHSADGEFIRVRVEDNGIGIEERYLDKIFLPFQRLHSREEFEGTGMGLAICQKIMELHRGHIGVFSEVGQGTVFTLDFPITPSAPLQ